MTRAAPAAMTTTPGPQNSVERFIAQSDTLHTLVKGLGPSDLDAVAVPGKWSLRTLTIHVMDSDMFCLGRMKRIIAEDNPLLIAYDEDAFAASLGYGRLDLGMCCDLFRLGRLHMGQILRPLAPEAFSRSGVHNQNGRVTLLQLVEGYIRHVDHHMAFAREKLRVLGRAVTV
jgi:hypothetical protein